MMHVCIQVCIVCMYQYPSDGFDLVVVDDMDGTRYLLRYGTVWYSTVLPLGGEGMLVCMYACTCARVLGWAVLGWAVLCGAVLVRCGAGFIVGV